MWRDRFSGSRLLWLWRCRRGNVAIEAAFLMPILGLVLMGAIDFGFAYNAKLGLADATRAGVQYAADNYNDLTDISAAVHEKLEEAGLVPAPGEPQPVTTSARSYCSCGAVEIACSSTCTGGELPNRYVEITLAREFGLMFHYPFMDDPVELNESATMRVE